MKTRKTLALIVVAIMALSLGAVAFALPSPIAYTAEVFTDDGTLELKTVNRTDAAALNSAAADYVAKNFGDSTMVPLMSINVDVIGVPVGTVVSLNVAGVAAGDTVYVAMLKSTGDVEVVQATVVGEGKISYAAAAFGPTFIFKVANTQDVTLPQTGDDSSMMTLALVALGCAAIASVACVSLKRSR